MTDPAQALWIAIPAFSSVLYGLLFYVRRQDLGPVARWFSAFLASAAIWSLGSMMLHANPGFVNPVWFARLLFYGNLGVPVTMLGFTITFLSLRRQQSWIYAIIIIYAFIGILNLAGFLVTESTVSQGLVTNTYGTWGLIIVSIFWPGCYYPAIFFLLRELRRTKDLVFRNRLKYLLVVFFLLLAASLLDASPLQAYPIDHILTGLTAVLIFLSISRYQVLEMGLLIRRLGILILVIVLYVVAVSVALNILAGLDKQILLPASIAAAFVTAIMLYSYRPVRMGISGFIDRVFFPEQYNVDTLIFAISNIGNRLRSPGDFGNDVLNELTRTLQCQHATFFTKADNAGKVYQLVASVNVLNNAKSIRFREDSPVVKELSLHQQAIHVERLQELPRLRALWIDEWQALQNLHALVLVPIMAGKDLIGFLTLSEKPGHQPYTRLEISRTLPLLANQISIALVNSSLYNQEQTRANLLAKTNIELRQAQDAVRASADRIRHEAARAETLLRVADRLNAQLELDMVLNAVCEEAARAVNVPAASVNLFSAKKDSLEYVASYGLPQLYSERTCPLPRSVFRKHTGADAEILLATDLLTATDLPDCSLYKDLNLRSLISASMLRENSLVGALSAFTFGEIRQFNADEQALLKGIAVLAAQAIENARLYNDAQRRATQLQALRDVDIAITGSVDLRVTLKIVLDQVAGQLHIDAADVLLLNTQTNRLEYAAGKGFRTMALQHNRLQLGEGAAGLAALDRQPVFSDSIADASDSRVYAVPLAGEGFVTYVAMPLISKGEVKGVLEIYHRAPLEHDEEWLSFLDALSVQAAIAIDNSELFSSLQRSNIELSLAYESTLEGWARTLELRDQETEGHTRRVTEVTEQLARAMGMDDEEVVHIRRGALLHDIGKMGISDTILRKAGSLSDEEQKIMRQHPVLAFQLLSPIPFLRRAMDIPYCHHEKWDGTGYPRGLKGEEIPLAARIFAIVDVWDALRSDRPYHKAWEDEQVRAYLREQAGTHFDPHIVDVFVKEYPVSLWMTQPVGITSLR